MARQNLFLFFLALVFALVIKFAIHDQEQLSERVIEAQVSYGQAPDGMISYDLQESVRVSVRGSASDVSRLSPFTIQVLARIPEGRPGLREVWLQASDVRFNVAGDFEVLTFEPERLTIQVEERFEKQVPIRVRLTGEPSAGSRASTPEPTPSEATISGPRSKVERIQEVGVEVSLDGHARTFDEAVPLAAPETWVQIVRPAIAQVRVPMEEPELSITFDNLSEESPDTEAEGEEP